MLITSSSAVPVARDSVSGEGGQALPQWNNDLEASCHGVPADSSDSEDTKRGNTGFNSPFSLFISISGDDPRTESNRRSWHARWNKFRVFDPKKASHNPTAEQSRVGQHQFGKESNINQLTTSQISVSQGSLCPDEGKGHKDRRHSLDGSDECQVQPPSPAPAGRGHKNNHLSLDEDKEKGCHVGRDTRGETHYLDDAQFRTPPPGQRQGSS